jgi:uncharacterized iron-regulated protein
MLGSFPRRLLPPLRREARARFGWARLAAIGAAAAAACSLAACANSGLALPKVGGPIPVSPPHEETAAERAYWDQLAPARIIYIGETHTSNSDHEYQLDVLKGLKARGVNFTVAWEMFDVSQQPVLDAWNAHHLTTEGMLEKTDFQPHWGTYSVMYEKILRWTQMEGIPSFALNAPGPLPHKLAQGIALTPEERAELPTGFRPLNGGYEHFAEQMAQAPHAGANPENFYKAQLLWDQTMASRIVEFINTHPDGKLVVLIGRGHVDGGFGVPAFVSQKTDAPQLVVYPGGTGESTRSRGTIAWRTDRRADRTL